MCERCDYLTDILIEITRENERLRHALAFAEANGDAELATTIDKALGENAIQMRIAQGRMKDHVDADHPG
jgi:hypothetical protein